MKQSPTLLVIDDEPAICAAFRRFFEPRGWSVRLAASVATGWNAFQKQRPDVTFLDVRLPDGDGLELLARLRGLDAAAQIVVITAHGTLDVVARAVGDGQALDLLVKPFSLDRALELAENAARPPAPPPPAAAPGNPVGIVGDSPVMRQLYRQIAFIAQASGTVLVTGETGTGKELAVRAIHEYSRRREGPLVAVNCGAIPETLVESELFGHVRGAFTGAGTDRPGRFEQANGGTLFLDEIGDLPVVAQVKLLRVLDSGTLERVGDTRPVTLDVRVIAATNRDLEEAVREGRFRADLYYRLASLRLPLPRLAERPEDILPLARHFLRRAGFPGGAAPTLNPAAEAVLTSHSWPGNVRELKHAVERAAVLAAGGRILPEHLDLRQPAGAAPSLSAGADFRQVTAQWLEQRGPGLDNLYREVVEAAEAAAIGHALALANGNQSEAAARLGIHRNTLRHRLHALRIHS